MGGSLNPRSLAEYTGHLIQASKMLNSTDDATHGVTTGCFVQLQFQFVDNCAKILYRMPH
jgi:hypothetical protein